MLALARRYPLVEHSRRTLQRALDLHTPQPQRLRARTRGERIRRAAEAAKQRRLRKKVEQGWVAGTLLMRLYTLPDGSTRIYNVATVPFAEGEWAVTALEGPDASDLLGNHAHKDLGVFDELQAALAFVEDHAAEALDAPRCGCSEIDDA